MITFFARVAAAFVFEFRREYHRQMELRQPPCIERPRLFATDYDPNMALVDEFILRDSLYKALRRYSPSEQTPEA
jgi:hypothetical protein